MKTLHTKYTDRESLLIEQVKEIKKTIAEKNKKRIECIVIARRLQQGGNAKPITILEG